MTLANQYHTLLLDLDSLYKKDRINKEQFTKILTELKKEYMLYGMMQSSRCDEWKIDSTLISDLFVSDTLKIDIQTPLFFYKTLDRMKCYDSQKVLVVSGDLSVLFSAKRANLQTCFVKKQGLDFFSMDTDIEIDKMTALEKKLIKG